MKMKLRRFTAMFLVVSMVMSMVGMVPALAATSSAAQIATVDGDYAYYTVGKDTGKTNADLTGVNSSYNSAEAGGDSDAQVEVYKTISASTENQFDIELKVVTTDNIDELNITPDAAVVLVTDVSTSMSYNVEGQTIGDWYGYYNGYYAEGPSRISLAQTAANTFIKDFALGANGAERWVSVVTFGKTATTIQDWVDVANADKGTANTTLVNKAINDIIIQNGVGTNIEAGLMEAQDLLNDKEVENIKSLYVVLLTDGKPTYYIKDDGGLGGDGTSTSSANITSTNATAKALRSDASIYTLAFGEGSETCYTTVYGWNKETVTINDWLSQDVATNANMHIDASDGATLTLGFEQIVERIAQLASAWVVTDPMGQFITLDETSIDGSNNYTVKDNTITWNLKSDSPEKENGSYVYTLDYTVNLDTAAKGFDPDAYYLTNGYTELQYCFVDAIVDGDGNYVFPENEDESILSAIDFKVPAVCGDLPQYQYQVKHWLQTGVNENGQHVYADAPEAIDRATVDMWEMVQAEENTYENYTINTASSQLDKVQIVEADQVLNLYYDKDTTSATVNHHYYTVSTTNGGIVVTAEPVSTVTANNLYVGGEFEAATANKAGYDQITAAPDEETGAYTTTSDKVTIKPLDAESTENVVDYYYVDTVDSRTDVTVQVNHVYTPYSWELNSNGRYEWTAGAAFTEPGTAITQKYGTSFTATTATKNGAYTYLADETKSTGNAIDGLTVSPLTQDTVITLYYDMAETENENAFKTVTVTHHYEAVETYIDTVTGNEAERTNDEGYYTETIEDEYRVGETFKATERTIHEYLDETNDYDVDTTKPADPGMEITVGDDNHIYIYYTRDYSSAEETTVSVQHIYTYYEEQIDEETGKADWVMTYESDLAPVKQDGTFYVNEFFTASAVNAHDGKNYPVETVDPGMTIQLEEGSNLVIITYKLKGTELADASIKVTHTYETWTYDYDNGTYTYTISDPQSGEPVTYTGDDGEHYTAVPVTDFDGHDDWERTDENSLNATLSATTPDQTINLTYKREVTDLTEAGVTVSHTYKTTETYFDVEAQTVKTATTTDDISTTSDLITQVGEATLYGGMRYTEELNPQGYTFKADESTLQSIILEDGMDNKIDLVYRRSINNAATTTVEVIHHYKTTTVDLVNGVPTTTVTNTSNTDGVISGKYVGELYTATPKADDFTQVTTADVYTDVYLLTGSNVINIYYEKTVNNTVTATLQVNHIYTTEYASGAEDLVEETADQIVLSFKDVTHTFAADTREDLFSLTNITSENDSLDADAMTITLDAPSNVVNIYYERLDKDTGAATVTVNHHYATYDAYTDVTIDDGDGEPDTYASYVGHVFEADTFKYDFRPAGAEESYTYQFENGDLTITVQAEGNVIDIEYLREIDTTPVTPDEPDEPDEPSTPSTKYYDLVVTYVDEEGNELADGYTKSYKSGATYTAKQIDIDGYTFVESQGDATSGSIRSDKEVIYVYTAVVVDVPDTDVPLTEDPVVTIPDTDVPLVSIPETDVPLVEIPVEEVPLSDIPQTGDESNLSFLMSTALVSALGLAWLLKVELDEKKKHLN